MSTFWKTAKKASLAPLAAYALILAPTPSHAEDPATGARTTNSGIFDAPQAERGKQAYAAHCASCHGASLKGEGAPTLAGPFWTSWQNQPLGDLLSLIKSSMPQQAPESLPHNLYEDILAYMLQVGGYPFGSQPLPASEAEIAAIMIEPAR